MLQVQWVTDIYTYQVNKVFKWNVVRTSCKCPLICYSFAQYIVQHKVTTTVHSLSGAYSRNHSDWFWQICHCCILSSTDCCSVLEVIAPSTIEKLDVSNCFNVDTVAGVCWAQLYSELIYSIVLNVVNECLISRITLPCINRNKKTCLNLFCVHTLYCT